MKKERKPNRRTVNRVARQTAAHLRDLVATFCREHNGVEIAERHVTPDCTFGASWKLETQFGAWVVHEPSDPCTGLVSINTRFEEPERVGKLSDTAAVSFNRYSGKWNHNAMVDAQNDPQSFAETFLLDFMHRSAFIFEEAVS